MPISLTTATLDDAQAIYQCGRLAFQHDTLQKSLFPNSPHDADSVRQDTEYRLMRIKRRLQDPAAHVMIATDPDVEHGKKVLGYTAWYENTETRDLTRPEGDEAEKSQDTQETSVECHSGKSSSTYPSAMDVQLVLKTEKLMKEAVTELLGTMEVSPWRMYHFLP
jgi:hypothetical protein